MAAGSCSYPGCQGCAGNSQHDRSDGLKEAARAFRATAGVFPGLALGQKGSPISCQREHFNIFVRKG